MPTELKTQIETQLKN